MPHVSVEMLPQMGPFSILWMILSNDQIVGSGGKLNSGDAMFNGLCIGYPNKGFHGFSQSIEENSKVKPRLDCDCFLASPEQFIIYES